MGPLALWARSKGELTQAAHFSITGSYAISRPAPPRHAKAFIGRWSMDQRPQKSPANRALSEAEELTSCQPSSRPPKPWRDPQRQVCPRRA
jgi:hypothetical protein